MNMNLYVNLLADDLGVEPPRIKKDDKKFNRGTQLACLVSKNGKTTLYMKKQYEDVITMLFAVAHEMRHKYQVDNRLFNFEKYQTSSNMSKREYNLQAEELDANAYGYLVMRERFGVEIKFNGMDLDVIQKIRERAETIANTEYDVE